MKRVAIVGGGISGLAAAYYLGREGIASKLYEKDSRLGGTILTERLDGCLVEAGPDSWLAEKAWMLDFARELGLGSQVMGSNDSKRRTFVVRGGRLGPLPESMRLLAPSKPWQIATTPLLGLSAKARFALEWFRRPAEYGERSVADFVRDHFGDEAVEYLAQPMLAGVYGSPPERLSADQVIPRFVDYERTHGSILRGVFANRRRAAPSPLFLTLRDGMGSLVTALERAVAGKCEIIHDPVQQLERSANGWNLRFASRSATADAVVVATPAHEAGRLLGAANADLAHALNAIEYTSSIVAGLVYPAEGFGHPLNGFGLLVPRREKASLAACTWVNTKFTGRSSTDRVLLRAFLAGDSAERALQANQDEIVAKADAELRRWMGLRHAPAVGRAYRWERLMPQYAVGHLALVHQLEGRARQLPGLHLAGNGYSGLGVPDCVQRSQRIAAEIAAT